MEKTKKYISIAGVTFVGLVGFFLMKDALDRQAKNFATQTASRTEAICPALLSISRSARDTLIVMKAETLCNNYVLNNFK